MSSSFSVFYKPPSSPRPDQYKIPLTSLRLDAENMSKVLMSTVHRRH